MCVEVEVVALFDAEALYNYTANISINFTTGTCFIITRIITKFRKLHLRDLQSTKLENSLIKNLQVLDCCLTTLIYNKT